MKKTVAFMLLLSWLFLMFGSSCKEADDCEGCDFKFVEYSNATTFYEAYVSEAPNVLIDIRADSLYKCGHLDGAVNLPFEISYTDTEKEQWGKTLLEKYKKNTFLFIYGSSSFELNNRVAKIAFRYGYERGKIRIFSKGYDELKNVWK